MTFLTMPHVNEKSFALQPNAIRTVINADDFVSEKCFPSTHCSGIVADQAQAMPQVWALGVRHPPLRIALITETYAPERNSIASTLKRLFQGLRNRGHQLQVICPQRAGRGRVIAELGATWLPVLGLRVPGYTEVGFGLPAGQRLRRLWQDAPPDVVYVATQGPLGWSAVKEARRQGIPVVARFPSPIQEATGHYPGNWLENTVSAYLRRFHHGTAATLVSTAVQQQDLVRRGFHGVEVLRRGVDSTLYHPKRRSEVMRAGWNVGKDDMAVIYVGPVAPEGNLALAIRAFRAIKRIHPRARFVLVGDGPLTGEVWEENPDFIFCGDHCGLSLANHYASGDLLLFPSLTETFSNTLLEAMASGLAVVAYNSAANQVGIQHLETGVLAESGDEAGFIAEAVELASDQSLRTNLRRAARIWAEAFSWSHIVEDFECLLRRHVYSKQVERSRC